jgi:hypothetical protein
VDAYFWHCLRIPAMMSTSVAVVVEGAKQIFGTQADRDWLRLLLGVRGCRNHEPGNILMS